LPHPSSTSARVLNNVIYFAGRILAKEDDASVLTSRCAMYAKRIAWISEKKAWMVGVLRAALGS
jgi:hypothetical protein